MGAEALTARGSGSRSTPGCSCRAVARSSMWDRQDVDADVVAPAPRSSRSPGGSSASRETVPSLRCPQACPSGRSAVSEFLFEEIGHVAARAEHDAAVFGHDHGPAAGQAYDELVFPDPTGASALAGIAR